MDQYKALVEQAGQRTFRLEQARLMHQYVRESDELGEWIEEQYQVASSDEYGQDYEHLEVILASKSHRQRCHFSGNFLKSGNFR